SPPCRPAREPRAGLLVSQPGGCAGARRLGSSEDRTTPASLHSTPIRCVQRCTKSRPMGIPHARDPPHREESMANKMLIDAAPTEEPRVVVLAGNRGEKFDFESGHRRRLRGNIFPAKVTRVDPSLQAAFVNYGANRHGFLAFSEIHPDY